MGVTLYPSEVVVNRTLTSGGVDMSAYLFVSYHHVKCLYMYSQLRNYFNSENSLIYGMQSNDIASYVVGQ